MTEITKEAIEAAGRAFCKVVVDAIHQRANARGGSNSMSGSEYYMYPTAIAEFDSAISAALSTLPIAGEGKVKALVWEPHSVGMMRAESVLGRYVAHEDGVWWLGLDGQIMKTGQTIDTAKAASQADYETRIFSALISSPGKDGGQGRILPDNEDFRQGYSVGYADAYGDVSDLKAKLTALNGAHSPQPASTAQEAVACAARKQGTAGGNDPADCDWPFCGCDPHADKVIAAIEESVGKDGGQEVETAILDVIAERKRQIGIGYDAAHDDKHRGGEIIQAEWGVMRRIDDAIDAGRGGDSQAYMRFLTQAAAQLVAEVGRVKRALANEAAR